MFGKLFSRDSLRGEGGYLEIWAVAWPLIISTAVSTFQLLCNGSFLAHSGGDNLSAFVPSSTVVAIFQQFFIVTCGFVATVVAQNLGARRYGNCVRAAWNGLYLCMVFAAMILLLVPVTVRLIFYFSKLSPAVTELQKNYFIMMVPGIIASCFSIVLSSYFSATGRTSIVAVVSTCTCLLSIPMNYMLIFGRFGMPKMDIGGAGLASSITFMLSALTFFIIFLCDKQSRFPTRREKRLVVGDIVTILKFGVPSGGQALLRQFSVTTMIFFLGNLGDVAMAGLSMACMMNNVAWFPLLGLTEATAVVTGKYVGRKELEVAGGVFGRANLMLCSYMAMIAILYITSAKYMLGIYASPDTAEYSLRMARYVMYCQIVQNFFDAWRYINSGALKGAGDTRGPLLITILSGWCVQIPMAWLLAIHLKMPIWVCWAGSQVLAVAVDAVCGNWWRCTGRWRKIRVLEK